MTQCGDGRAATAADAALEGLPLVQLSESGGFYMRQGQPVLVPNAPCDGMVRVALETGEFLGLERYWTTGAWRRVD